MSNAKNQNAALKQKKAVFGERPTKISVNSLQTINNAATFLRKGSLRSSTTSTTS